MTVYDVYLAELGVAALQVLEAGLLLGGGLEVATLHGDDVLAEPRVARQRLGVGHRRRRLIAYEQPAK